MSSRDHLPSHIKFRLRTNLERLGRPWYNITAPFRALPNFIIIGAARSGSTHFFYTLQQHPQIATSRVKEVSFFSKDTQYARGERGYRSNFPLQSSIVSDVRLGEATPMYLYNSDSAERIKAMVPNARLIVLLRNPTERTISHFFYNKTKTRSKQPDNRTIEEFVLENDNLSQEPLVQRGLYAEQLKRYQWFIDNNQLLILKSEDMFSDRDTVFKKTCEFLDIDSTFTFTERKAKNAAVNKTEVSAAVREKLDAFFAPHNQALADLLQTKPWWQD